MGLLELLSEIFKKKPHKNIEATCPKCKAKINLGMERCPSCGTHIESMFRLKCPRCEHLNDLKAVVCEKCGYSLIEQRLPSGGKVQYRCPICGYVADYYMTSCPSCGVKFV